MDASILRELTSDQLKTDLPEFGAGDTVRIHVRVIEGDKERTQIFEGTVIQRRGSGIQETFTVRKISQGIAIERIFSAALAAHHPDRAYARGPGAPRPPLLLARSQRPRRPHPRKAGAVSGGRYGSTRRSAFYAQKLVLGPSRLSRDRARLCVFAHPTGRGFSLPSPLAPVLLVVGYCVLIPMAILVRDQSADQEDEAEQT